MESVVDVAVQSSINQLSESRISYIKSKILLSSLKDILHNKEIIGSAATKVKNILYFGDLNEYLEAVRFTHEYPIGEKAILGIMKNSEYKNTVALTDGEKNSILNALRKNLHQKNSLVYEIFCIKTPRKSLKKSPEDFREFSQYLENIVHSHSTQTAWNIHVELNTTIHKCYEEVSNMHNLLAILIKFRSELLEPYKRLTMSQYKLEKDTTVAASRTLLGTLKKELYSNEGKKAVEIIHSKQVEEIEIKKQKLKELRDEMSKYEELKSDGFDELLKDYMAIKQLHMEKERLKEEYFAKLE